LKAGCNCTYERELENKYFLRQYLIGSSLQMLYSDPFGFEGTRHRQISQGIKQSNHGALVVTAGVRRGLCPLKALRRTAFSRTNLNISTPTFVAVA
jgi:hypothetical protein